jgi:hypothetical protein
MKYLFLFFFMFVACAQPVVRQRELGAIHSRATIKCKSEPTECHKMMLCGDATRKALADWQAVSVARSKLDDAGEVAALALAEVSDREARALCNNVPK